MTDRAETPEQMGCGQCGGAIDGCEFCGESECRCPLCYECVNTVLGQALAQPHGHGG